MTQEQLRKIDALIAEKVMGLDSIELVDPKIANYIYPDDVWPHIPDYTTDIAAAWTVVERLDGQWKIDGQHLIGWEVSFVEASMREDRWVNPFKATAEGPALAICLAALRALGVDEKEWA